MPELLRCAHDDGASAEQHRAERENDDPEDKRDAKRDAKREKEKSVILIRQRSRADSTYCSGGTTRPLLCSQRNKREWSWVQPESGTRCPGRYSSTRKGDHHPGTLRRRIWSFNGNEFLEFQPVAWCAHEASSRCLVLVGGAAGISGHPSRDVGSNQTALVAVVQLLSYRSRRRPHQEMWKLRRAERKGQKRYHVPRSLSTDRGALRFSHCLHSFPLIWNPENKRTTDFTLHRPSL